MRLFVAIDLDEAARRAIAAEQTRLERAIGAGAALRWVRPADMHLTLVFIGEIEEPRVADIVDAMRAPIGVGAFTAVFGGIGVFPPHGSPSVLWLGVRDGGAELTAIQSEMAARLERAGVPRESRSFHPHLTLARCRSRRPPSRVDRRRIAAASEEREIACVGVDAVTLYRSQLSSAAPQYSMLARAALAS